jgi:hypothetical protein
MPADTQPPKIDRPLPPQPGAIELIEEVADLSAGLGLGFMSFLGAIPGLLPAVALTVAALAILAIPMVVVGIVVGVVYLVFRAIARIAGHAASLFRAPEPERVEPGRVEPAPAAPELTRRLPVKGPHAMV